MQRIVLLLTAVAVVLTACERIVNPAAPEPSAAIDALAGDATPGAGPSFMLDGDITTCRRAGVAEVRRLPMAPSLNMIMAPVDSVVTPFCTWASRGITIWRK